MSFAGTPLGQGRRLDHQTFLGKAPSNGNKPIAQRIIPTSYAYGAPALGSRSPPKASSSRERIDTTTDHSDNDSALTRFAKAKQQTSSDLNPEKWSVRDTTVNAAGAIYQAALAGTEMSNPNNSWASGSRTTTNVPRSTSVEYESQSQSTNTRRLGAPPSRLGRSKPLSKNSSSRSIVPDSEGESQGQLNGREKSPFEQLTSLAQTAIQKTSYFVRERERDTEPNGSYDYSAEDREYQQYEKDNASAKRAGITHRKNRISTDNKAYKPTQEELEESSDDDVSDDGRRRRKKKSGPSGGPLTTLPKVGPEKRRKKAKKGAKGTGGAEEEEEEEESDKEVNASAAQRASVTRNSLPPPPRRSQSRQRSLDPNATHDSLDNSHSINLDAIPEDPEAQAVDDSFSYDEGSLSSMRTSRDGIGAKLGSLVFSLFRLFWSGVASLLYNAGRAAGAVINLPLRISQKLPLGLIAYFAVAAAVVFGAWTFRDPLVGIAPRWPSSPKYTSPGVPVENAAELNARLQAIESALSTLMLENEQTRIRTSAGEQGRIELVGRLGTLEGTVKQGSERVSRVESSLNQKTDRERQVLVDVQKEMESLKGMVGVLQSRPVPTAVEVGPGNDEEARAKLTALEERLGSVEGGVKEALDLGKSAVKTGENSGWWNKVTAGKKGLTIKSSDGQDVTSLITHLVDDAVSLYRKDGIARPDFALHSGGARVIPSLTSDTYEIRPPNLRAQLLGMVTGVGYAVGRPPVYVLNPDITNGYCWPFAGTEGQLGVALAAPTFIEDITIDHIAKEIAYDIRSAPRQMEVWGMVEGRDNIARVKEWDQERERLRSEARERGEEVPEEEYPQTLPKNPRYIRLASFVYNIYSPQNVQTFPVRPEIKELGIDFGIVALIVRSNWGMDDYTCLYRMRVHGQRMGEKPLPYPEEMAVPIP
ncbi:hypothetical protein GYMLUDRAFT_41258 [Collybiopsis luxurians FD-317 M1]|uniref:Unplaced genomic scaffold GYMLUscaffold_17, whole genome shotgun sequence n=1 Tax=Collybiopsis luxurians FD-317 M1 TaxID=944289 RepID=A0A0D0D1G5_9AGAR|nr:hypothetical protein GYMLUDRAFT_41258 [Collybiopsis luxurians FD-317 M1]